MSAHSKTEPGIYRLPSGKWHAIAWPNGDGKTKYVGIFNTKAEAITARESAMAGYVRQYKKRGKYKKRTEQINKISSFTAFHIGLMQQAPGGNNGFNRK